jgi:hypothetical protein
MRRVLHSAGYKTTTRIAWPEVTNPDGCDRSALKRLKGLLFRVDGSNLCQYRAPQEPLMDFNKQMGQCMPGKETEFVDLVVEARVTTFD